MRVETRLKSREWPVKLSVFYAEAIVVRGEPEPAAGFNDLLRESEFGGRAEADLRGQRAGGGAAQKFALDCGPDIRSGAIQFPHSASQSVIQHPDHPQQYADKQKDLDQYLPAVRHCFMT